STLKGRRRDLNSHSLIPIPTKMDLERKALMSYPKIKSKAVQTRNQNIQNQRVADLSNPTLKTVKTILVTIVFHQVVVHQTTENSDNNLNCMSLLTLFQ